MCFLRWPGNVVCVLACGLVALAGCTTPLSQSSIAIVNVTVIDAAAGARAAQSVVFDGDEILFAGPASDAPPAATVIDGAGKFLIPGLWDMHVHLTYDDRFTESMPREFLRYGITSVRDTGGMLDKLLPVVERMRQGDAAAPRVFFSGPLLDGERVVYGDPDRPLLGVANDTAQTAKRNVRRLHDAGVDFIKVYEMLSEEVFYAITETANELGLPVAAHVPLAMRASQVAPQVDSLEHLRNVVLDCVDDAPALQKIRRERLHSEQSLDAFDLRSALHTLQRNDAIERLDEERCAQVLATMRNTIQVPTARLNTFNRFPMFQREDFQEALRAMPASVQKEWGEVPAWFKPDIADRDQRFANFNLAMIARMHKAGVPIGAGTDTPIFRAIPGYSLHSELQILVVAGLTPLDALGAATVRPAQFFGLEGNMGAIAKGMRADLVLLDANPLDDIRNTRAIRTVFARGVVVNRGAQ